jgi:hypothetical protein
MMPAQIRSCMGVSQWDAYDLLDVVAATVEDVQMREPLEIQTGNGPKRKQKSLLVDWEEVHGLDKAVNSLITTNKGGGIGHQLSEELLVVTSAGFIQLDWVNKVRVVSRAPSR